MHLARDLFVVPDDLPDRYVLYAPLLGIAARVNRPLADRVAAFRELPAGEVPADAPGVSELARLGLVAERPFPRLEPDSRRRPFAPTSVTLFLTGACNLACRYCHADSNARPAQLDGVIARAAFDLVLAHATERGRTTVGLCLHGGGEPTVAWESLQGIVEYARRAAAARGVRARISVGTNGVLPEARARWLAGHADSATLSLDGCREAHDAARPTVAGGPTYDDVLRTARCFDDAGLDYGIRMTVTASWVDRLPEAVGELCGRVGGRSLKAEPVFPAGRAERGAVGTPTAEAFIAAFREARAVAVERGRRLSYSGARLGLTTDRFCHAPGTSFAVTPEGRVTSCYEATDPGDPRLDPFFWGRYESASGRFVLDEARRAEQTRWTVHHQPGCADCFCKWTCAGDCPAKRVHSGEPRDPARSARCAVNRALTRDQLLRALQQGRTLRPLTAAESEEIACT